MVFQAFAAHYIAERKKKIVVVVVMGVEKLLRFDHQVLVVLQLLRRDLEIGRLVGEEIEEHLVVRARGEVNALEIDAGVERRVDQSIQRSRFEVNQVSILRSQLQRSREFPALRQPDGGIKQDASREVARRIKQHAVPGNVGEVGRDTALLRVQRSQILEIDFQRGYALRYVDVEGIHIHAIADPVDAFAVRRHGEPGHVRHRVRWGVRAGKPLRIEQRNFAALDRYRLMHIQHAIEDVGDIDAQRDGAGIRRVRRRGNGRRQRYRLRGRPRSAHTPRRLEQWKGLRKSAKRCGDGRANMAQRSSKTSGNNVHRPIGCG